MTGEHGVRRSGAVAEARRLLVYTGRAVRPSGARRSDPLRRRCMASVVIAVRVEPVVRDLVAARAAASGRSLSDEVREVLERYVVETQYDDSLVVEVKS